MNEFKEIKADEFKTSPFKLIGKNWMLITAEKDGRQNAMTASWGGMGVIWGKNAAFIVVRPQRYTKEFIDAADGFSLSFFNEKFRKTLSYMGTISGRDEDKIAKSGLSIDHIGKIPYFKEAETVLICRKMYAQNYQPECFIDKSLD